MANRTEPAAALRCTRFADRPASQGRPFGAASEAAEGRGNERTTIRAANGGRAAPGNDRPNAVALRSPEHRRIS